MGKLASPSKTKREARSKARKTNTPYATFDELKTARDAGIEQHGQSQSTKKNYKGYITRGYAFLAGLIQQRRSLDDEADTRDGLETDKLAVAFEKPPNEFSASALILYLTQKCMTEGCGQSTADGIHGAFAHLWDRMFVKRSQLQGIELTNIIRDGTLYSGEYKYDPTTKKVTGNPARAPEVRDFMKVLQNKHKAKGSAATRDHAEAMTYDDLHKIMRESERQYPTFEWSSHVQNGMTLYPFMVHMMMRAFMSSGFTLWTRNFELCQVQFKDIEFGLCSGDQYRAPYFKIFLENRKGWQRHAGFDAPGDSNTYHIYQQEDTWAMDMHTHLLSWLHLLQFRLGRPLEPNDYIFPYFSTNGIVQPGTQMTHEVVQDHLDRFAAAAGVSKRYTTHSFRRGGAQYRFMYAPLGKRWPLSRVRWWGGWAEGENVDVLMKYLLDSLQSAESSHADALNPAALSWQASFAAERDLLGPPSTSDFRAFAKMVADKLADGHANIAASLSSMKQLGPTVPPLHQTPIINSQRQQRAAPSAGPSYFHPSSTPAPEPSSVLDHHPPTQPTSLNASKRSVSAPIPGVYIPAITNGPDAWRTAVAQWEVGDLKNGLRALKDWPTEWYTGAMRTSTGSKRNQRKIIAEEFARLGRDEQAFVAEYPAATRSLTALLNQIRAKKGARRNSKNGTPESRDGLRNDDD